MATYNRPGVYVNELALAATPVNSSAASNAAGAVVAAFSQGPDNVTLVTSWYDFVKKFGGYNKSYPATFSVGSFFKNGGNELYVKRILPGAAKKVAKVILPSAGVLTNKSITNIDVTDNVVTATVTGHGFVLGSFATVNFEAGVTIDTDNTTTQTARNVTSISATTTAVTLTAANHGFNTGNPVVINFPSGSTIPGDPDPIDLTPYNGTYNISAKTTNTFTFLKNASAIDPAQTPSSGTAAATSAVNNDSLVSLSDFNGTFQILSVTENTFQYGLTHANVASTPITTDGVNKVTGLVGVVVATFAAKHRGIDGNNIRIKLTQSRSVRASNYYDISVYYEAGLADIQTGAAITGNASDDLLVEQFNGVVFDDPLSGDYIKTVLDFNSTYIRILDGEELEYNVDGTEVNPAVTYSINNTGVAVSTNIIYPFSGAPAPETNLTYEDYTGDGTFDPAIPSGDYDNANSTVFQEFETIDRPLVFFMPDVISKIANTPLEAPAGWGLAKYVFNSLLDWIEAPQTNGRHFAVIDTSSGLTVNQAMGESGDLNITSRAAVYYPHVYITDPLGRSGAAVRKIGPSGAVVGQYLATDQRVGPFKTPAGIDSRIVDAIALERSFSPSDLDALNSGVTTAGVQTGVNVVNAIRNLPGAGVVIMGGRTLKQDGTANRYVNMRRSLIYLEKRLNDIALFAVFENNTERLWARLITALGGFLNEYRNQGGLRGTTVDASFYVKCDGDNNTPESIRAGEVHAEIGVALEYPAEFVVINLSQKTAE
jgi:hypothetical protein